MTRPLPPNPFNQGYLESETLRQLGFRHVGNHVKIAQNATIIGLGNISVGNHVRIDGNVVIGAHTGSLVLGNHIHIGSGCYLGCAGGIELSDFCGLSQGTCIYSGSDDYSGDHLTNPTIPKKYLNIKLAPVFLGKHVIIGSGSVILPGATIGEGVAVGALSLVTHSLAAWGIYCGTPAKKIKSRSQTLLVQEAQLLAEEHDAPSSPPLGGT